MSSSRRRYFTSPQWSSSRRKARPQKTEDYRTHFYANHRSFFILFGLWVPVDVADTLLKRKAHFISLGPQYVASAIILGVLFAIVAITKNARFHACLAVYFVLHTILICLAFFRTLM